MFTYTFNKEQIFKTETHMVDYMDVNQLKSLGPFTFEVQHFFIYPCLVTNHVTNITPLSSANLIQTESIWIS